MGVRGAWVLMLVGCYAPAVSSMEAPDGSGEVDADLSLPRSCGNRVTEPPEECDDGNRRDGDACSARCLSCVVQFGGHCYEATEQTGTSSDVFETCTATGGYLVTYGSLDEEEAVWASVYAGSLAVWIGLDDPQVEGDYRWVTGVAMGYTHWTGTPGPGMCGAQGPGSSAWDAISCLDLLTGICEREGWAIGPERHAYQVSYVPRDWALASDHCAALGAHLVTIGSLLEEAFVTALFSDRGPPDAWIGYQDGDGDASFEWVGGETADYQAWASGEPNGAGNERCVRLTSAGWRDENCTLGYRFVCEID